MKGDDIISIINSLLKTNKFRILHITLTPQIRFYNGVITDIDVELEEISLNDLKLGHVSIPFNSVYNIEPFIEKKGEKE